MNRCSCALQPVLFVGWQSVMLVFVVDVMVIAAAVVVVVYEVVVGVVVVAPQG